MTDSEASSRDFIRRIIELDIAENRLEGEVVTRFPPEPNGYLHIGHAKSIVLNFGLAEEYGGRCHLRFDDTNPITEDEVYAGAIREDVGWLGYDWGKHLHFASDYFEEMYARAEELIGKGLAYVDSQTEEAIRDGRGTVTQPGRASPFRERTVDENLDLFRRMREGEFAEGEHVLRARIDMSSANMLMRDPVLYRIRHARHFRTGDKWCIYPLYDFAHPLEDAFEGVTHSLCTLEFANNRELYDWIVENAGVPHRPRQYEFARLNLDYTIMSKRKLLRLVQAGKVGGWDDPRMLTIAGLRRRGFTPEAIRTFCEMVGVARSDSRVDMGKLEYAIRDDLNRKAPRVLAVLDPLKVTLDGWPPDDVREIDAPYYPHDVPGEGSRGVPFSRELYIDRPDFAEDPPKGFRRLVPGGVVRLRYACVIRCEKVVRDEDGEITELLCHVLPDSWGGRAPEGTKVKGTIQWVSAAHAVPCEVRLYDRLFAVADPEAAASEAGGDLHELLNPASLEVKAGALVEPSVLEDPTDTRYQFERLGYFWRDPEEGSPERPVFNRIVTLRDTWTGRDARKAAGSGTAPQPKKQSEEPVRAAPVSGAPPELSPEVRARAERLAARYGLEARDAEVLARDEELARFFERAAGDDGAATGNAPALANWLINEVPQFRKGRPLSELPFGPDELAGLVALVEDGVVSSSGGQRVLEALAREGGDPRAWVDRLDLAQIGDADQLRQVAAELIEEHPGKAEAYRGGKTGLLGFFMGQMMRRTDGKADPEAAKQLLREALEGS